MAITRKTDGNFGKVSVGVLFPESRINENGGKSPQVFVMDTLLRKLEMFMKFHSSWPSYTPKQSFPNHFKLNL